MIASVSPQTNREKVELYVREVMDGSRTVGIRERQAVERYLRDLEQAEEKGWYFDEDAANWAIDWFLHIQHTQGEYAGNPFVLYPIQAFMVWNLFGWKIQGSGLRRFTDAFISFGRGNGKTPLGVGLVTQATGFDVLPDGRILQRANGYIAATKKDQAGIGFGDLKSYIEFVDDEGKPSELSELCEVYQNHVLFRESGSTLEPLSSDARVSDGFRIQALLKDEIHAWTKLFREFNAKLDTALGKFPQPLCVTITTAGNERSVLWKEQHTLASMVLDPENDLEVDELFAMVCQIDEGDDPLDERNWPKANPLLIHGVVKLPHLRKLARKAAISSAALNEFVRFHANAEVSSQDKPITSKGWGRGNVPFEPHTSPSFAAVDLGWAKDLAAVAHVWPVDEDGQRSWDVEVQAYIPRHGGERDLNLEPWRTWVETGLLTVTDSAWTDTDSIYADLRERVGRHGIQSLAYDPNNAREFALNCLNELGIEVYAFPQNCRKYNEPVKALLRAVGEGRIRHNGNSLLAWCATNLILRRDAAGHAMPDKEFSEDKIDPIVAVIMAISESIFAEPEKPSVYESRGPLFLEDVYERMLKEEGFIDQ